MGADELHPQMPSLQGFGNSLSFLVQVISCTVQRASLGCLDLLSPKSGGNVSTFTADTCTAGIGGSLQKLTLGQHMLQEDALQFVRPHEQVVAEQDKQRLNLVSIPLPHITAQNLKSLTDSSLPVSVLPLSCTPQLPLVGRDVRNKAKSA